jgi:hypothetical protein
MHPNPRAVYKAQLRAPIASSFESIKTLLTDFLGVLEEIVTLLQGLGTIDDNIDGA